MKDWLTSSGMKGLETQTKESARRCTSLSVICFYCAAVGRMFILCGADPYAPSVFVNSCYESYHLLQNRMVQNHMVQSHMLQSHMMDVCTPSLPLSFPPFFPSSQDRTEQGRERCREGGGEGTCWSYRSSSNW